MCWSRPMAAPVACRHPCDGMTVRSLETDGRSRQHRAGGCAKEHGGATTKLFGSSRDACPGGRRAPVQGSGFLVLGAVPGSRCWVRGSRPGEKGACAARGGAVRRRASVHRTRSRPPTREAGPGPSDAPKRLGLLSKRRRGTLSRVRVLFGRSTSALRKRPSRQAAVATWLACPPFRVPYLAGITANASISISQSALTSADTPTVERAGLVGFAEVPNTSP